MQKLWPFFCFYGGKWRGAPRYPKPVHSTIVEPFAGSAGYAVRYPDRRVVLVEIDPILAGLWRYLIRVTPREIEALPSIVEHVDSINVPQEARWLIGFWLHKATGSPPRKQPTAWMRSGLRPNSYWGDAIKRRIASQVSAIRHWEVIEGGYDLAPDIEATWFVDPPYSNAAAKEYSRHQFSGHEALGVWCKSRRGQLIACENFGATWLPFEDMGKFKSIPGKFGKGHSREAIWTNDLLPALELPGGGKQEARVDRSEKETFESGVRHGIAMAMLATGRQTLTIGGTYSLWSRTHRVSISVGADESLTCDMAMRDLRKPTV